MLLCAVAFQNFEDPIDILEDIKAFLGKCVTPLPIVCGGTTT